MLDRRRFLTTSASTLALAAARPALADPVTVVAPVAERMGALEQDAPLAMRFTGKTADEARRWQADFGRQLRKLLGPCDPPSRWKSVLERRVELGDHVREERLLVADGVAPVPFYLLLPLKRSGRVPGMLAIHGHGRTGYDWVAGVDRTPEAREEIAAMGDYGRMLAARGYVVAVPCLTPFGRRLGTLTVRRGDACTLVNLQLQYLGRLLIAENLRDILWTLEYLIGHEAVDPERIGCAGLSLGGRMTTMTAAVEPRIRVAVISGAMNCLQERALHSAVSGCQLIPGLLEYGDIPEISGLIAPRPCVWEVGSKDALLPAEWTEQIRQRQGRVYAALDAADRVAIDRFEGGHQWHGTVAYQVLEKTFGV